MMITRIIAVIALIGASVSVFMATLDYGPELWLDIAASVDLGNVYAGDVRETAVSVANRTSHSIEILQVSSSCTCTNVRVSQMVLAPGDVAEMLVTIQVPESGVFSPISLAFHKVWPVAKQLSH